MSHHRTKIGPRGRVTIPVALQREAGLAEEDEVVLRVVAPGEIVIETPSVVKERLRSGVPSDSSDWDAMSEIRADREAEEE